MFLGHAFISHVISGTDEFMEFKWTNLRRNAGRQESVTFPHRAQIPQLYKELK